MCHAYRAKSTILQGKLMTLCYPNTDIPFEPSPAFFLGEFDIYDREETLGEYLNEFDPNDRQQLRQILNEKYFRGRGEMELSAEHKIVLVRVLAQSLQNPDYNFSSLFDTDPEDGDVFSLPFDWKIKEPRMFFEEVYRLATEFWADELRENKSSFPDLAELGIPPGN